MAAGPHIAAVVLEAEGSAARILIDACADPSAVTREYLASRARERGVELSPEVLRTLGEIAERFGECPGAVDAVFVRATPPVHGEDARIEWRPGYDPEQPVDGPAAPSEGRVDHYTKQCFIRVAPEDHLATVRTATRGVDGRDVTGCPIAAKPGSPLGLEIDQSIRVLPDGRLVAQRAGRLRVAGSRLLVDPMLDVNGTVDFHTGHIDFQGDVHIREDIRDRFRVRASGSIAVDGLVDACHLECGKDLFAPRGIAGRGEGSIRVGQDAVVGYLDQLTGAVGRTLRFRRSIRRCVLTVGGDLMGESGSLVSGTIIVAGSVQVAEIGSPAEAPTELRIPIGEPESAGERPAKDSTVEVLRMLHAMVTLTMGPHTVTFTEGVRGPIQFWLSHSRGLMFRQGEGEAQLIRALKGATAPRAAA
ncbi:MAG TPA: FapA family protein [Phycisphaerales bacterium]|nr:FapA family protein [Phycisphaerales bacterium]